MRLIDTAIKPIPLEEVKIFFGEYDGIQRYDRARYSVTEKLTSLQQSQKWFPKELNYNKDRISINSDVMSEGLKTIYQKNLASQTVADSYANRYLDNFLSERVTSPEWERVLKWQANFELLHSESYAENINIVYPDPSKFFDEALSDPKIRERLKLELACVDSVFALEVEYDNDLIFHTDYLVQQKAVLLDTVISQYALESIRFMVSFLYTFKIHDITDYAIPGTFNAIGLIAHDEFIHTVIFKHLINALRKNKFEGFTEIFEGENYDGRIFEIFAKVIESEVEWFEYLSTFEEIPGMDKNSITDFLMHYANEALENIKVDKRFVRPLEEPTPLIDFFEKKRDIAAKKVLGQENDVTSYTINGLEDDDIDNTESLNVKVDGMLSEYLV